MIKYLCTVPVLMVLTWFICLMYNTGQAMYNTGVNIYSVPV